MQWMPSPGYKLLYMQQGQESAKIEAEQQKGKPSAVTVRNRRYKKLQQLRNQGFFSEEAIKLRHPLLYHNYLGKHSQRNVRTQPAHCTLSQFLQKNLINLEYKQRLAEQLQLQMEEEKPKEPQESWQLLEECSGEISLGKDLGEQAQQPQKWEIVQEEEIELQEQNLIDHAEQLFLQGKVDQAYLNYHEIDHCEDYDLTLEEDRDAEERYFARPQPADQEEDRRINQTYFTGVQDY